MSMEGTFCSWLEKSAWLLVHKTLKSRKGSAFDSLPIHCTVLSGQGNNAILPGRGTLFTTPFPIKGYSCVRVFVRETSEILFREKYTFSGEITLLLVTSIYVNRERLN